MEQWYNLSRNGSTALRCDFASSVEAIVARMNFSTEARVTCQWETNSLGAEPECKSIDWSAERSMRESHDSAGERDRCVCRSWWCSGDFFAQGGVHVEALHQPAWIGVGGDGAGIAATATTVRERMCMCLVRLCRCLFCFLCTFLVLQLMLLLCTIWLCFLCYLWGNFGSAV